MRRIGLLVVVVVAVAGCSTSAKTIHDRTTVTVTAQHTVSAPPPRPSTSSASASSGFGGPSLSLRQTLNEYKATVQVLKYQKNSSNAPAPEGGGRWDSILTRVCVMADSSLSWQPWHLTASDDSTFGASNDVYEQFPQPKYPDDERDEAAGTCVRGWITFGVTSNAKITQVTYTGTRDSAGDPIIGTWRI